MGSPPLKGAALSAWLVTQNGRKESAGLRLPIQFSLNKAPPSPLLSSFTAGRPTWLPVRSSAYERRRTGSLLLIPTPLPSPRSRRRDAWKLTERVKFYRPLNPIAFRPTRQFLSQIRSSVRSFTSRFRKYLTAVIVYWNTQGIQNKFLNTDNSGTSTSSIRITSAAVRYIEDCQDKSRNCEANIPSLLRLKQIVTACKFRS